MRQRTNFRKLAVVVATAGVSLAFWGGPAEAGRPSPIPGNPTCQYVMGSDWENHGDHVLFYVNRDGNAGGGTPSHRDGETGEFLAPPGATFCL